MTQVVKSDNKKLWLVIFLFLCVTGFAVYDCYINHISKKQLESEIHLLRLAMHAQASLQNEQTNNLTQKVNGLQDKLAILSSDKLAITKYQLNELIAFANQLLLVYHDPEDSLRVLNYAKNLLINSHDAVFVEIKLALSSDITSLNQVPKVDTAMLSGDLDEVIKQIDKLPLVNFQVTSQINKDSPSQSKWRKFFINIKNSLVGIVQISKLNSGGAPFMVLPDEEFVLRQGIKLDLLNARTAILERNNDTWQRSLTNVKINIQSYFADTPVRTQLLINLDELLHVNLGMSQVNIDQTVKALNQINAL